MTLTQRALFRVLLVVLLTVLALMLAAPVSRRELNPRDMTISTAPDAVPVLAHIEETQP